MIQQTILHFNLSGRGTYEITKDIVQFVNKTNVKTGLCHLFIHHTSASVILCENADAIVRRDLETFIGKWIPDENSMFEHNTEGEDDMPAHLRTIFTHSDLTIPITNGQLALGTWQGIFIWEHRHTHFRRKITITILGE